MLASRPALRKPGRRLVQAKWSPPIRPRTAPPAGAVRPPIPTGPAGVPPAIHSSVMAHPLSHTHGLYASSSPPSEAAFEEAGRALVEQSIVDAGGRSELGARELADHQYRGVLHVRILKLSAALDQQGEFDRRHRLRKGWIELLDRLISSAVAIDKTLGLGRRPRKVPTLQEYLEQRAEQQPIGENPSAEGER